MNEEIRDQAEPIAEEIIQKIAYYIRYKLERWPTTADLTDMKRIVKSIIVQHLGKSTDGSISNSARDSARSGKD